MWTRTSSAVEIGPPAASKLTGQRIYPGAIPTARICFSFERNRHREKQCVELVLQNELSAASAATLLHFIRHTAQLYFECITFPNTEQVVKFGPLNSAVLSAVVGNGRKRGWIHSLSVDKQMTAGLWGSKTFIDVVKEMVVFPRFGKIVDQVSGWTPAHVDRTIHLIAQSGHCIARKLDIYFSVNTFSTLGFFERLVKVFHCHHIT